MTFAAEAFPVVDVSLDMRIGKTVVSGRCWLQSSYSNCVKNDALTGRERPEAAVRVYQFNPNLIVAC
jgi:hypothetical protein